MRWRRNFKPRCMEHFAIDTGMGRMGLPEHAWSEACARQLLNSATFPGREWGRICLRRPRRKTSLHEQIGRFRKAVALAHAAGLRPKWIHLDGSAGLLGYPQTAEFCNLARPGLALYGVSPAPEHQALLKPALAWKTRVILVRDLPAGHGISYGRIDKLTRNSRVATLACGYADGYPRQVSGKGAAVLIRGRRCPLLGRVTMDQMMVDVTDLAGGVGGGTRSFCWARKTVRRCRSVKSRRKAGTIPWHIFTGISARVERVMV